MCLDLLMKIQLAGYLPQLDKLSNSTYFVLFIPRPIFCSSKSHFVQPTSGCPRPVVSTFWSPGYANSQVNSDLSVQFYNLY